MKDHYRQTANDAVHDWLSTHVSNTVASAQIWQAVNVALDRWEDEHTQASETHRGWVVLLAEKPVIVVATKRQARQHRRYLRRMHPARGYRIAPVDVLDDCV